MRTVLGVSNDQTGVIGDVHGDVDQLVRVVGQLPASVTRLIFVGDYVNRGPRSREVIDYCIELGTRYTAEFVRGNHDRALLDLIRNRQLERFLVYGGAATIRSYISDYSGDLLSRFLAAVPRRHVEFLENLVPYASSGRLLVTHRHDDAVPHNAVPHDVKPFRVSGHQPTRSTEPHITNDQAMIDTGCGTVAGAPLTCFLWPSRTFVQSLV